VIVRKVRVAELEDFMGMARMRSMMAWRGVWRWSILRA
jgi:hypothetical protein